MMQRLRGIYPFLFAIIPILNVVSRNPGYADISDLLAALAFVLVGTGLLYLLLTVILRQPIAVMSLTAFWFVVWFYASVPLAIAARDLAGRRAGAALGGMVILGTFALGWWAARRRGWADRAASFLTLTSLMLVGWLGARIIMDQAGARRAVRRSAVARKLAQPMATRASFKPSGPPLPDIYLIVLDEYANAEVLRERFQFDNRAFEDSLRRRGFTIPQAVRSNYAHTILSLPSLLNFSHLTELSKELGEAATDPTLPDYLLEHNRTVPFLKSRGYRFLLYPSQWWPATRHSEYADAEFQAWHGFNLARELTRSHFRRSLTRMTPLGQIFREPPYDSDHIKLTLEALKSVPAHAGPTFVFAHVMSPHYPYVFQANCQTVPPHGANRKRVAYVNQLQCLNRLVLAVVRTLLERSPVPPVILLQGDHGTSTLNFSWAASPAAVSAAQARERFGAFGAYYLPHGGGRILGDTVTVVNVLQKVVSYYFGAEVAPSADELYMSIERRPYDFVRVNPATLVDSAVARMSRTGRPQ